MNPRASTADPPFFSSWDSSGTGGRRPVLIFNPPVTEKTKLRTAAVRKETAPRKTKPAAPPRRLRKTAPRRFPCCSANPDGDDLQNQRLAGVDGQPRVYEHLARLAQGPWNLNGQLGLVVGATYPAEIERVRELAPTLPLLIPGVGAQGGDAHATVRAGYRERDGVASGPIVVNSSRAILYASAGDDYAAAARAEALRTRALLEAARG